MGSRLATTRPSEARCMPYPELVTDGPAWTVLDSSIRPWLPSDGVTDKVSRLLYAPLQPDGYATAIHELAHCAWSPTRLPRVRFEPLVLHAVEDARINLALEAGGLRMELAPARLAHVRLLGARDLHEGRTAVFVLRAVASLGTNAGP
ncbi:MAG: hypothetical protein HKP30_03075, partial [Myxococcales bacterium]|nr:hypothetical protein [Myxococcales bacterium]